MQKSFHLCHPKKNYFLKFLPSNPDKYGDKTANTQARQKTKMTVESQINSDLTMTMDRRPVYNSVYVAIASEVVNRRSVLLKNFEQNEQKSASNPLLHIHANRSLLI
jgi:hypothetical protein